MKPDARESAVLALCWGVLVFCAIYALNPAGPRYYPLEGVWRWENIKGIPSMAWYARVAYASSGAALAFFLGRLAARGLPEPFVPLAARLCALGVSLALLAASAYLAWDEYRHWVAP